MAGLAKNLSASGSGLKLDSKRINSLFWADDIVLLSDNHLDLEKLLKMVSEYCSNNKLTTLTVRKQNSSFLIRPVA